jgi:hypothetical protein
MMIEAGLEFMHSSRQLVIETFLSLPEELRPTHESVNEDEVGQKIKSRGNFLVEASKRKIGFFLKAPHITYNISFPAAKPVSCSCFLDTNPTLAKTFMLHMASAQPLFGFACAPEEREWRNRVTTKQGINSIESWVGRDIEKYVPGLYWITLLPFALAERHNVSLSAVESIALEHIAIGRCQNLFCFYKNPTDWRSISTVTNLCSSLPGLFDVEKVRPQLLAARNFLELSTIIQNYK